MQYVAHIAIFLVFMGVAWVVNRVSKQPTMNGALLYLIGLSALLAYKIYLLIVTKGQTYMAQVIGELLPFFAIGIYFTLKFRKKQDQYVAARQRQIDAAARAVRVREAAAKTGRLRA